MSTRRKYKEMHCTKNQIKLCRYWQWPLNIFILKKENKNTNSLYMIYWPCREPARVLPCLVPQVGGDGDLVGGAGLQLVEPDLGLALLDLAVDGRGGGGGVAHAPHHHLVGGGAVHGVPGQGGRLKMWKKMRFRGKSWCLNFKYSWTLKLFLKMVPSMFTAKPLMLYRHISRKTFIKKIVFRGASKFEAKGRGTKSILKPHKF